MKTQFGRWLSLAEAVQHLGCSATTLRRQVRRGQYQTGRVRDRRGWQVWIPTITLQHCCEEMKYYLDHEDDILYFWERVNEYLIPVHDGGSSGIVIRYCPWCGSKLPESTRHTVLGEGETEELRPEDGALTLRIHRARCVPASMSPRRRFLGSIARMRRPKM
jgi:hypothetical protein